MPKTPAEKRAYRIAHPNHGGAGRGQGRKRETMSFRKVGGGYYTAAEMKRIETAILKFGSIVAK